MIYCVYILSNKRRTVFYTGVTRNLRRRVLRHKDGTASVFTKKYNCNELLYYEEYGLINDAIKREKELKKFKRDWKFQLITKMNPEWVDLSSEW